MRCEYRKQEDDMNYLLMEIIDRLIMSGLDETEAICLIGAFLEREADSMIRKLQQEKHEDADRIRFLN